MYHHFLSFFFLSLVFFFFLCYSLLISSSSLHISYHLLPFLFSLIISSLFFFLLSSPLFSFFFYHLIPSLFVYLFLISSYSAEDIVARDGYRLLSSLFMQIACLGVEEKIMLLKVSIVCNMINWNTLYCDLIWFSSGVLYNDIM